MENNKRWLAIVVLSSLFFVIQSSLYAKDEKSKKGSSYVKDGIYLELFGVQNRVGGDFSAITYLETSSEVLDVPDVDPGYGFGISLGNRGEEGAFEISYQRSTHDTHSSFIDIGDQDGYLNIIDFNFKFDVFPKKQVRPYILLGFGFPWLTITNSLYDSYEDSYEDATFIGISGNIGCGLAYYFTPRWCLTGGMTYRWMSFMTAEGRSIEDDLDAGGPCLRLGIAFTF
jgi:hypothetical protein